MVLLSAKCKAKKCVGLDFKFVFYLFQLKVQMKQEILSLYTSHLIEYLKPNKNDEIKNNKNKIKTVATDFLNLMLALPIILSFFKLER